MNTVTLVVTVLTQTEWSHTRGTSTALHTTLPEGSVERRQMLITEALHAYDPRLSQEEALAAAIALDLEARVHQDGTCITIQYNAFAIITVTVVF